MNGLTFYEMTENYRNALAALTDPEAELPQEVIDDTLEGIRGEIEDKAINVAKAVRNLEVFAEAIKEQEAKMSARRRTIERRAKWLRDYLKRNLEATGNKRIESLWFVLSIQNNRATVDVTDGDALPGEFKEDVVTTKYDKNGIYKAIKDGIDVPGARLLNGTKLVIR